MSLNILFLSSSVIGAYSSPLTIDSSLLEDDIGISFLETEGALGKVLADCFSFEVAGFCGTILVDCSWRAPGLPFVASYATLILALQSEIALGSPQDFMGFDAIWAVPELFTRDSSVAVLWIKSPLGL